MSDFINTALADLDAKAKASDLTNTVKYVIEEQGAILIDGNGAQFTDVDTEADLTLNASAETFEGLMDGSKSATMAFMSGKLKIEGDMGLAMRLDSILG